MASHGFAEAFDIARETESTSGETQSRLRSALWASVVVHILLVLGFVVFWPLPPPALEYPQFQITLQQSIPQKPVETEPQLAEPTTPETLAAEATPKPTEPVAQPQEVKAHTQPLDLSLPPLETPLNTLPPSEPGAIFHPQLNARFHQALARKRARTEGAKPARTYINTFGEEIIEFNGGCAKIQRARDHHDVDTVALPTPCPGHQDEGARMMERLNENLRKRYGTQPAN